MKVKFKFNNGEKVQCKISGVIGTVDASALWINGCVRYSVQPRAKEGENKMPESWWIDEASLILLPDMPVEVKQSSTGGPSSSSTNDKF